MSWQFLGTNTLIWQPDTRVQTFPSGLVLVQRSAVCRNTYLTTARGSLTIGGVLPCDSPSTVTVFQFPQAQEMHEGNGFIRFDVSGYGYAGTGLKWQEEFVYNKATTVGPFTLKTQYVCPRIFQKFVVPTNTIFNPFSYIPTDTVVIYSRTGSVVSLANDDWSLESSDVSDFGNYQEVTVVFAPEFTLA
jgi:hypothetical protein